MGIRVEHCWLCHKNIYPCAMSVLELTERADTPLHNTSPHRECEINTYHVMLLKFGLCGQCAMVSTSRLQSTMTTLTVHFPEDNADVLTVLREATESMNLSDPPQMLRVEDTALIHEGDLADVYKGVLMCGDEKKGEVVLKVIFGDSDDDLHCLEVEDEFYRKLEPIQGKAIPVCYGLFRAPNEPVACLMLEFGGSPLECNRFRDLDIDLRPVLHFTHVGRTLKPSFVY